MRAALAMTVALALGAGPLRAAERKPPPPDVGAGRVAWFDLTTSNLAQSRDFYAKLFGWTFTALQGTDLAVEIVSRGEPIGTLRVADGKISPFNGVVYLQVADLAATCQTAKQLGATIPPGFPFNLPDRDGAIALVVEPGGHPLGLYSRTPLPPPPPRD